MQKIRYRIYAVVDKDIEEGISDEIENLRQYGEGIVVGAEVVDYETDKDHAVNVQADFEQVTMQKYREIRQRGKSK